MSSARKLAIVLLALAFVGASHAGLFGSKAQGTGPDKSADPQAIRISDLPSWQGDTKSLLWLTPNESNYGGSSHESSRPDVRLGVKRTEAVMHPYRVSSNYFGNLIQLPGGWEVSKSLRTGCLEFDLNLHHPADGRRATWVVQKERDAGFFSRRAGCIGGSSTVFYGVLLNSRYFAFETSEPGLIFFDRLKGEFLPYVLQGDPNLSSHLYVDGQGQVLVEIQPGTAIGEAYSKPKIQEHGVKQIILGGSPLIAPWNPVDLRDVAEANAFSLCIQKSIIKSYEQEWVKAKAKDPNTNQVSIDKVDGSICKLLN
jgi:hypothetical protein